MIFVILCALAQLLPAFASLTPGYHEGDSLPKCVNSDPRLIYSFKPGCSEWMVRAGRRYFVRYNRLSLRGDDYPATFAGMRVLFTGPSILFGTGVSEEHSIPRALEARLRRVRNRKVQIINAGQEGYSTLQSAIVLPEFIAAYHPNVLLHWVMFAGSTMRDTVYYKSIELQNGYPYALNPLSNRNFVNRYIAESRFTKPNLFRFFYTASFFANRAASVWWCKFRSKGNDELSECLAEGTLRSLAAMQGLAKARGIPFYVVYSGDAIFDDLVMNPMFVEPVARLFERITPKVFIGPEVILSLLRRRGFPVIFLQRYRQLPGRYFFPNDYHPNEKGIEATAQELAEQVRPILEEIAKTKKR